MQRAYCLDCTGKYAGLFALVKGSRDAHKSKKSVCSDNAKINL